MAAATAVDAAYTVAQGHAITSMTEKARAMLPAKINRNVAGVAPIPILVSRIAKTSAFFFLPLCDIQGLAPPYY